MIPDGNHTFDNLPVVAEPSKADNNLKGHKMSSNGVYVSLYDQRVKLVADALAKNSEIAEPAAVKIAVHILHALDHIPEKVR